MTKVYIVTEWVVSVDSELAPSYIVGVYSTVQLAQDALKATLCELVEVYPERAPFQPCSNTDDVCMTDAFGNHYHYNIIERTIDQ